MHQWCEAGAAVEWDVVTAVNDGHGAHFSRLGERLSRLAEDAAFLSRRFFCFSRFPSFSLFLRTLKHPRTELSVCLYTDTESLRDGWNHHSCMQNTHKSPVWQSECRSWNVSLVCFEEPPDSPDDYPGWYNLGVLLQLLSRQMLSAGASWLNLKIAHRLKRLETQRQRNNCSSWNAV